MSPGGQIGTGRLIGQWVRLFCFAMAAEMILEPILCGEHLPFKTYTKVDGLGAGEVHRIVRDSRGFLWFCTDNGLTLFDGRRFLSYDAGNSHLAFPHSNDLLETAGSYWVATNGDGVWRFAPADPSILQRGVTAMQSDGSARITRYSVGREPSTNRVNVLYKDDAGRVWAGTDGGLFRLEETADKGNFRRVDLHLTSHPENQVQVWALLPDADGSLWVGTRFGLLRIVPSRGTIHYEVRGGLGSDHVFALLRDNAGRIWVGHQRGLAIFVPRPVQDPSAGQPLQFGAAAGNAIAMTGAAVTLPGSPGEVRWFKGASSSLNDAVLCLQRASDGHIWIGTQWSGVVEFDGNRFRMYGNEQGLTRQTINALAEDDGGLWFGSSNGALRLVRNGIVSYHSADGLGTEPIVRILRDPAGRLYFVDQEAYISRFDGSHFLSVRPNLPRHVIGLGWGRISRTTLLDHVGDWWIATRDGLCRFSQVNRLEELGRRTPRLYTTTDGLSENDVVQLFEDSRGDVWISYFAPTSNALTRWERRGSRFLHYSGNDGLSATDTPVAFSEDSRGNVWLGYRAGGLARYTAGKFQSIALGVPDPPGGINSLFRDRSDRIWAATTAGGLLRIDHPTDDHPSVVTYTKDRGLSGNTIRGITEDRLGRIYVTTEFGVDRIDPHAERVRHYGAADGLADFDLIGASCDPLGEIWFAAEQGIVRLAPHNEISVPPTILIRELRIAGVGYPISDLGVAGVRGLTLDRGQNHLHIEFFALGSGGDEMMRFQYRLLGSAAPGWSAPSDQRAIEFANLAPGRYEFDVRAINADGQMSRAPAVVSFAIPVPLLLRWWVLTIVASLVALSIYALHRNRVARIIELERVRTRIATDLHDDIGSTLSQIAVLSEVLGQRLGQEPNMSQPLSTITNLSRDLIDSLSDIVWAINPLRDSLGDLIQRMRQFANDLFAGRPVELQFQAPIAQKDLKMGADTRREVFLIFKEGMNNILRHSNCKRIDVEFAANDGKLQMTLSDDGQGFDCAAVLNGNGLPNMRQRAARLGGTLTVISDRMEGTVIRLMVPMRPFLEMAQVKSHSEVRSPLGKFQAPRKVRRLERGTPRSASRLDLPSYLSDRVSRHYGIASTVLNRSNCPNIPNQWLKAVFRGAV